MESVRHNIVLGNPDATDKEIKSADNAAHAHEFFMSCQRLVSGGQKQRLAIA